MSLLNNFWALFVLSAPWLMLGLLLAGILNAFIPKNFLQKHLGKEGLWTTVKAAFIGAPMPLCSCGVIPAAVGLRRAGGSKSATTAFLVSTPETGVDSVSVSYVLLGPFMAVIRPIAAVTSAITAGLLVGRDKGEQSDNSAGSNKEQTSCCTTSQADKTVKPIKASCCDQQDEKTETKVETHSSSCCATNEGEVTTKPDIKAKSVSCCASKVKPSQTTSSCNGLKVEQAGTQNPAATSNDGSKQSACCGSKVQKVQPSVADKCLQAVKFSCNKLLSDTMSWLMIGLFFAALVQTYVPTSFFSEWGNGIAAMVVVILVSIPMYICATASTPIAAGLLLAGVSPGAVLVFMLAGPATNVATLGVVATELGKRAVIAYLTGVIGVAIVFGLVTDVLVEKYDIIVSPNMAMSHEILPTWFSNIMAVLLIALMARLVLIKFRQSA
jgi:uncharacterized membrane protein YraQ (UPF0718 family)